MTKTAWQDFKLPTFPKLSEKKSRFDVVIVGGGITGLSAAYFLKQAGKRVCLVERKRLTLGDTGCTTAHLTYVTDERLTDLVKHFGREQARLTWQAGQVAIDAIESTASAQNIACEFQRIPGFLHAPLDEKKSSPKSFEREAELARELGFDADFTASAPLVGKPGIRFANQAKFHPLMYLAGLAKAVDGQGCAIYEQTEVTEVQDDPLAVKCGNKMIDCDYVVIATHVPMIGKTSMMSATFLQTKIFPYTSYVLGANIPRGTIDEMSLWDTASPYHYLRIDAGPKHDYAIFGGADHKTGQLDDPNEAFLELQKTLKEVIPAATVDRRWSGQVIDTDDGLPFIGQSAERQFIATGFAGNGMTFGTLSGLMARDAVLGRDNPWAKLFAVNRTKIRGAVMNYLKENVDYPYYFLKDRLMPAELSSTRQVERDTGAIVKVGGQKVAASRDAEGKLTQVSPYCTHMGCIVHWNKVEKTWDCPCHGSRFQPDGKVVAGPAESPLETIRKAAKPKKQPASAAPSTNDHKRKSTTKATKARR